MFVELQIRAELAHSQRGVLHAAVGDNRSHLVHESFVMGSVKVKVTLFNVALVILPSEYVLESSDDAYLFIKAEDAVSVLYGLLAQIK